MPDTQHTAGPWSLFESDYGLEVLGAKHQGIASLYAVDRNDLGPDSDGETARANARLMAAAPELLASLGELLEWARPLCAGERANIEAARVAIERALRMPIEKA